MAPCFICHILFRPFVYYWGRSDLNSKIIFKDIGDSYHNPD